MKSNITHLDPVLRVLVKSNSVPCTCPTNPSCDDCSGSGLIKVFSVEVNGKEMQRARSVQVTTTATGGSRLILRELVSPIGGAESWHELVLSDILELNIEATAVNREIADF